MRGEVSSITPTAEFASRVRDLGITLADFGRDEREEVLVLTRRAGTRAARITERINLKDTAETRALTDAVRTLNAFLASADIAFIEDGLSRPARQIPEAPLCAAPGRICGEVRSRRTALRRLLDQPRVGPEEEHQD
jgi:hypothetical protein